jgi:arginine decarboxylase
MNEIDRWSIEKSRALYGIDNWGSDYFSINERGHITVSPDGEGGPAVDLYELVEAVHERRIELPLLFRFNGIIRHRIRAIYTAFHNAIEEHNYEGKFFPAYPIKVNQQRHIVDVIREVGREFSMGLEVGSKPELLAVLALHDNPNALLLCNGYKDQDYIELALMSQRVGRRPVIIIEKYSELPLVLSVAKRLGVVPAVGFRLRLAGKGAGRWERSGGDRAKFGLTIGETLQCFNELKRNQLLGSIQLLHFHIGSQLTTISALKDALKEALQVYVQLRRECPNLNFFDVGGGLGVDYDGSKTNFASSMNYTLDEYARDIVWTIDTVCRESDVPRPNIITESGRATVAHHSVLVFDVLGIANTFSRICNPDEILRDTKHETVKNMAQLLLDVTPKNCQETLHDAMGLRSDMLQQFNMGLMSIEDRAAGDETYWALLSAIGKHSKELHYIPEDLEALPALLTDTYFCNLSVFQSLPDSWAIQQIFPITPVHRLNEEPTRPVVLADITCDSDGKIDRFADLRDVKRYLSAHPLRPNEPYYFAAFLVGAYQEILGDLHNLFGDTNAVHVEVGMDGRADLTNVVMGDNVNDVLKYVQYDKDDLCMRWRNSLEQAVSRGDLTAAESGEIFRKYAQGFEAYTYLRSPGPE